MFSLKKINPSWTLFIDRDGVINHEVSPYTRTWNEFEFYEGVKEAFNIFDKKFGVIVTVTNQRGVARNMVHIEDLQSIHKNMLHEIEEAGGRIDKIYFCAEMESPNRKPNPGMGLQAIKDFPEIDLSKSIMIGNTLSDMKFGRNLGVAVNIFLPTTLKNIPSNHEDIDLVYNDLISVAKAL